MPGTVTPTRTLSEDERCAIASALRLAAEHYAANAKELATIQDYRKLGEQFSRQQAEATRLADIVENAETITLAQLTDL